MALAASGVSLLLAAAALDKTDTIDGVSKLGSVSRRLVLVLGVLSACSLPPFPGFVAVFPLASAVLDQSHSSSLGIAAAVHFLLTVGAMRVVARAWDSTGARTVEDGVGLAALGLAIAATILLSIAPAGFVELARAAALAIL
jgi:formate hydrogenlyase subunit 3/multisubunit Na+/H+ antiporter MnhD subunit